MSMRSSLLVLGAAGLLLAALPSMAKTPQEPINEMAVIYVTGSTNTRPSTVVVFADGGAFANGLNRGLPIALNHRFFNHLKFSMPLTRLPARHGMKSASFGTSTFVIFRGQKSPDLTLPSNDLAKALKADVAEILTSLN